MTNDRSYMREWYAKHPLYARWQDIRRRCCVIRGATARELRIYGTCTMCDEWRNSYAAFEDWALSNGWARELDIALVDKGGSFSPGNCVIVPQETNINMRRNTRRINGIPLRVIIGDTTSGRNDTEYRRVSNRVFKCGWDVGSAIATRRISLTPSQCQNIQAMSRRLDIV